MAALPVSRRRSLTASWSTSTSCPGLFIEVIGKRLLRFVADELLRVGMEITLTMRRVELHGP